MNTSLGPRLDSARWHLSRYDELQANLASRAATLLSADALILGAAAILVGQYFGGSFDKTSVTTTLVAAGAASTLLVVAVSISATARVLLALRPWRKKRIGQGVPRTVFYLHNDTLAVLGDYDAFSSRFKTLSVDDELEGALAALWIRTKNYQTRVRSLRVGLYFLFVSMVCLSLSAVSLLAGSSL